MSANIDLAIIGPALLTGLLVTLTHVPLGQRVLARGIIFLDLAVAQIAGLGVVLAHSFGWQPNGWQVQLTAVSAAIAGVLLLHQTEKRWPQNQEALIGSLFVVTASLGILLLSANPHGAEQLKELLVGQILWVSYAQLIPVAIVYSLVAIAWLYLSRTDSSLLFYLLFSVTITASVQLVGIYLVFASLILPALAILSFSGNKLLWGYAIGVLGYLIGLLLASLWDLPAGAMIVVTLASLALLTTLRPHRTSSNDKHNRPAI